MEEAPENGKESPHSVHANGLGTNKDKCDDSKEGFCVESE